MQYKMEDESLGEELKRVSDKFRQYNRTKEKGMKYQTSDSAEVGESSDH